MVELMCVKPTMSLKKSETDGRVSSTPVPDHEPINLLAMLRGKLTRTCIALLQPLPTHDQGIGITANSRSAFFLAGATRVLRGQQQHGRSTISME